MRRGGAADVKANFALHLEQKISVEVIIVFEQAGVNLIDETEKICRVIVPDYQLSLAIGKEGQNARLAAKLTGWKIDIKSESQAAGLQEDELL